MPRPSRSESVRKSLETLLRSNSRAAIAARPRYCKLKIDLNHVTFSGARLSFPRDRIRPGRPSAEGRARQPAPKGRGGQAQVAELAFRREAEEMTFRSPGIREREDSVSAHVFPKFGKTKIPNEIKSI